MKRKKIIYLCTLLCAVSIYLTAKVYLFPKEINILAGTVNTVDVKAPFRATLEAENVAVLNINNKPVTENINIDLGKQFLIETQDSTSFTMILKLFGIPVRTVKVDALPADEVIPCGMTVGVLIDTDGILVLGTGYVNGADGNVHHPCDGVLKSGDLILEADGKRLERKEDLIKAVEGSKDAIKLKINRENEIVEKEITPVKSIDDGKFKIGIWVRDSTRGIGTITYYNPKTREFAALGHGIQDIDTKKLMSVKTGRIMQTDITTVKKGKKGSPGELMGDINNSNSIGIISSNTSYGIYGQIDTDSLKKMPTEAMKIALQGEVHEGPAKIRSNINGWEIEEFDIYIESINRYSNDDSKGIVVRIVDPKLLQKTNGIVQGMSGSPIIQEGKLVGAVTHVFVQDPTKGYGIFIENMMKQGGKFENSF